MDSVRVAASLDQALSCLGASGPYAVIIAAATLDGHDAPSESLPSAIRQLVRAAGQAQIVLIADRSLDLATCCEVIRAGASAFVDATEAGIDDAVLLRRIAEAQRRYEQRLAETADIHLADSLNCDGLIWRSPAMARLLARAARAAQVSDVPVLISGESGTGKQLLAELIHRLDPKRNAKRFLCVNCSTISGTLAESTLFGHVRGAYTGATQERRGHFRAADGGVILLDEIGELDITLQPKLLRALQCGAIMPLGSDDEVHVDVRVIAATNRQLAALVEEGRFRLDLYQRLNVITLEIPPLRERPEDIPGLVRFFVKKYADYCRQPIESIDPKLFDRLSACSLSGNVRELENVVRQMLAFKSGGSTLTLDDLAATHLKLDENQPDAPRDNAAVLGEMIDAACRLIESSAMTLPQLISVCEELVLRNTLERRDVTSAELARRLGLSRRTLYNKITKYSLPIPSRLAADQPTK